jgi:hypothetical protein
MIQFMVIEKHESGWQGLGRKSFLTAPSRGDMVTLDDDDHQAQAYEIIAAADIFVRHLGSASDWRSTL